eukprot:TRINITY_DN15914_c0_g1_i2.p1 TRINITY_DN15914_c0_g1~~TRINITY_DN15914_c0_g1_i2.p1  ORF type:complete len:408 (+),score=72.64 TRINITY_DN15914_c0_g1_i2:237-1460(+)
MRGDDKGLLTKDDLNAIRGFIQSNRNIPHKHRKGHLQKLIPDTPFKKTSAPSDNITGLKLAPMMPLESSIDVPIRFEPPAEFGAPKLIDLRSVVSPVQQLFMFMKNASGPPSNAPSVDMRKSQKDSKSQFTPKTSPPGARVVAARDYVLRALTCRRAGQRKQESIAYFNTAALYYNNTDYDKAIEYLTRCIAILEKLSDRVGLVVVHNIIGICYHRLQKYKTAIHHYKKQESLCGYYGRAIAQVNMGVAYSALDEKGFAIQALLDAVDNSKMTQDMCVESISLGNLGLAYLRYGNLRAAQENLESCMELCSLSCDEAGAAICLLLLGEVYSLVKDYKRAQFYFSNALRIAIDGGVKDVEQVARVSLGVSRGNDQYNAKCSELISSLMGDTTQQLITNNQFINDETVI